MCVKKGNSFNILSDNVMLGHGDCLELMQNIHDGSIDMILCDLPFGVTQNDWVKLF